MAQITELNIFALPGKRHSFSAKTAFTIVSPVGIVAGLVYIGGIQRGDVYLGGVQKGELFNPGIQRGMIVK